jgi:hypothetical protein
MKLKVTDEDNQRLLAEMVFGRSGSLYIVRNGHVYRCDVRQAAGA